MLLGAADSLNSHLFLALSYFRGDVPPQAKIQMCPDRGFQKKPITSVVPKEPLIYSGSHFHVAMESGPFLDLSINRGESS